MTATLFIGNPRNLGCLARLAVAEPIEQCGQDRPQLILEAVWRIDQQHAAAVEPAGIDRLTQQR